jgi:hypothetical protein
VTASDALNDFAKMLDENRPSTVQLQISPAYNNAIIAALEWAADQARKRADELQDKS